MNKRNSWGDKWRAQEKDLEPPHTHTQIRTPYPTVCHRLGNFHWVWPTHFFLPRKKDGMRKQNYENQPLNLQQKIKKDLPGGKTKGMIRWFSEGTGDPSVRNTRRVPVEVPIPLWTNRLWPKPRVSPSLAERNKSLWDKSRQVDT